MTEYFERHYSQKPYYWYSYYQNLIGIDEYHDAVTCLIMDRSWLVLYLMKDKMLKRCFTNCLVGSCCYISYCRIVNTLNYQPPNHVGHDFTMVNYSHSIDRLTVINYHNFIGRFNSCILVSDFIFGWINFNFAFKNSCYLNCLVDCVSLDGILSHLLQFTLAHLDQGHHLSFDIIGSHFSWWISYHYFISSNNYYSNPCLSIPKSYPFHSFLWYLCPFFWLIVFVQIYHFTKFSFFIIFPDDFYLFTRSLW